MIQIGSSFNILDNTGVKKILCIGILNSKNINIKLGDLIIGVVKISNKNSLIKKSFIVKAIVINLKKSYFSKNGLIIKFNSNWAILIDNNYNPLGTKVYGILPKYLVIKNYLKLKSLYSELI
uniref:50S ribosomal protein L14 n=1 Tax=Nephromyces sp. ex Molgula occidentalis TaxID=2544991 RepID=A0A5C1H9L4_9APIC|nr:50S ribosomal protein L14 [Nephromyces sp. ex Molgula occidentalis]